MKRWLRRLPLAFVVAALIAFAATIAFDSPGADATALGKYEIPGISQWNRAEVPPTRQVMARDGAPLSYRPYPGRADRVVVLVHGSAGSSLEMHRVAQALQAAGASVYAVTLRGHDGSGAQRGDVVYRGQLDDDLADLMKGLGLDKVGVRRTLIGFSAGGGFVLRIASGREQKLFDSYLAVSPYVANNSVLIRSNSGWARFGSARIAALSILDDLGLPLFQELPVVRYATADKDRTPVYSYRLRMSLQMDGDWQTALTRIQAPTLILTASGDELFSAARAGTMVRARNSRIEIDELKGLGHVDMIVDPAATAAVAKAWRKLVGD